MRLVEIGKTKEGSPLATLADDIERNELAWKEWAALEAPEAALMPADLTAKLSLFEQLLVSPEHLALLYLSGMCSALMHAGEDVPHTASQPQRCSNSRHPTLLQTCSTETPSQSFIKGDEMLFCLSVVT